MAAIAPPPVPPKKHTARLFLAYGIAVSVIVHLLVGPWIHAAKPVVADYWPEPHLTITHASPTPEPPKPTPPPVVTPPPAKTQPPPTAVVPKPRVVAHEPVHAPPVTHSDAGEPTVREPGTVEPGAPGHGYAPVPAGEPGEPGTGAPPTLAPTDAPTLVPTATPTPPPTCEHPNVAPRTVSPYPPDTPEVARQTGVTGTVTIEVQLDAASRIVGATVREGPAILRQAALAATRQSQFQTEIRDCKAFAATYLYVVDFQSQ